MMLEALAGEPVHLVAAVASLIPSSSIRQTSYKPSAIIRVISGGVFGEEIIDRFWGWAANLGDAWLDVVCDVYLVCAAA